MLQGYEVMQIKSCSEPDQDINSLMFYCLKIFSIANFDLPVVQSLTIKGVLSCLHDDLAFVTQ